MRLFRHRLTSCDIVRRCPTSSDIVTIAYAVASQENLKILVVPISFDMLYVIVVSVLYDDVIVGLGSDVVRPSFRLSFLH
ncbi:hypothetical protein E2C01_034718 [Portunus trituberculatus]|uniref:Uncharacterized protein n=1 Tax=Portunus trituberculatus TaxID=210409 RepID=A0A5B7F7R7_PORTR|nr:hypothetical protein [Portunus trituberculatus]